MNKQLFPASGTLAINAVAEDMLFTALVFSGRKKFEVIFAGTGQERCHAKSPRQYWLSQPSLFQKFRKLINSMAILPITNKDATWPVKLDHEASFCNFSPDVRMNGGGDAEPSIIAEKKKWIGWLCRLLHPGWQGAALNNAITS